MVAHCLLICMKSAMASRLISVALLAIVLPGCAQTAWQHADGRASLQSDSQECAVQAKRSYPTRMIGHRVVDNAATRQARENFKVAVSYKSRGQVKPPVVYVTRKYDSNRHARIRHTNQCLRSKGWINQRGVAS